MTMLTKTRFTAMALAATMLGGLAVATPASAQRDGFQADRTTATAQINQVARDYGYADVVHVEQSKKHLKGYTRDADGNQVEIKIDRWGNLDEIEVEYGWRQPSWGGFASEAEIRRNIEAAGYSMLYLADRKKNHYEVMAENSRGDVVELHVSHGGQVYKSKLKPMEFGQGFSQRGGFDRADRGARGENRDHRGPRHERGNDRGPRHERGDDRRS